ncbi:ubiquitin carboxyl-terminal hydrolase 28 isoform X2 [Strigops habroptila]|nr:ubiquitin carboxyl-terminal hydrolase 28 isoform X2 [Strigops habroptila]XP_032776232.1 ubiquitin carboxyl-terminal hydrolase 28 isoform X2 [Strigops habroptila]
MLLDQLKEITGIQDSAFLHAALKAANGDLMEAVTFLTEENAQEPARDVAAAEPSAWEGSAVGKQLPQNVTTALTSNNKDDLRATDTFRPLESPKTQAVERDAPERPQEAHSAENKSRSKRKRCEVWGENPKHNGWRRVGDWPVGMKNIGNTCWFSAVIQSLFQLPEFRRLVLGYSLPQHVLEGCHTRTGKRNVAFMQELQCLFALMLGTRRKFVDPSAALELLRGAFRSTEEQQQDVSEFTHKLLDWLEDAFQLTVNVKSPEDKSENPMVQLFYGTFLTEGVHEGNTFSKIETFGQYPLQVNGYRDLNECLEGAMVEGEVQEATASQSGKYRQERWFTKLPPVLTFELSRFEFNQSLGQPEKIHTKLEFPQTIYMDRYLYCSKELIQMKREEMKRLSEKLVILQQKLERYMKYGSGPARFPLPDMLQYVLEFVATKPAAALPPAQGSQTTPLQSQADPCVLDVLSQPNGILERGDSRTEDGAFSSPQQDSSAPLQPSGAAAAAMSEHPAPHVVSEEELNLVRTCLERWRTEIEQDVQDLKESIARISLSIEQIYCDPLLQQVPYRLHAVLVHEGQANAGHYWAFIYDQPRKSWLKYNDISVTESSWEELERDSFGGLRNASAYCLMYISEEVSCPVAGTGTRDADEEAGPEVGQFQKEVEDLPLELRHYIQEDNWRLEQEAEEWEEEQSCKIPQMEPSLASDSQDLSSESGPDQPSGCVRSLSSEHARIAQEQTAKAIANSADTYDRNGVEAALCEPKEVEPVKAQPGETALTGQAEQLQDAKEAEPAAHTSSQVMLSPAMQGVILAIAKARQTFDRDGSEAGLVKAFHEEYSRLYLLSKETPTPQNDARLQHVLIYFLQNNAPQQVVERTLLEQFADKNLSYDERSISIMKVARAKLREIGPDDVDMEEYKRWHEDYSLFRKVSVYLLTGLELYQNRKYQESLTYLVYAYQSNTKLLQKGTKRGVSESLIALYRRNCLLKLNEVAASMFVSCEEARVAEGISILNELIIPCMHLMNNFEISREDMDAIEVMRNRWCSYLGREDMDAKLQMRLGEVLPRLLDCPSEVIVLKEPPKIRPNSPYDLCSRFAAVMESIHGASTVTVK